MQKKPSSSTNFFRKHLKKVVAIGIIIFLLLVIRNITYSIIELENNSQIVSRLKQEEISERRREQFLKERLYYVKTPEFIERQAREKLGMVKTGEYIVLAPPTDSTSAPIEAKDTMPNWEKWWRLFF